MSLAYPKVVEGGVGDALPGDVLGDLVEDIGVLLRVHERARYKLAVRPDREMPRLYPHQVVERKLQDQPPFCTHLHTVNKYKMFSEPNCLLFTTSK